MKRLFLVGSLAGLASLAGLVALPTPSASAHGPRHWQPVAAPLVSVTLEASDGRALPAAMHAGQMFVAGEHGQRYEIRLTNNSADRVEIVLSVDGRDAVSGRPADFRRERGYVLEPFATVTVDGFRTSLQSVAAFRFTSPGESFAGRHGSPTNAGVIGVAVFKERRQAIARGPRKKKAADSSFVPFDPSPGTSAPTPKRTAPRTSAPAQEPSSTSSGRSMMRPQRQELGTGFGEARFSAVREVTFVRTRADRPDFVSTIRYDSAHALADRGVPIEVAPARFVTSPDVWPGATDGRFTAPPPLRHGRR